MNENAAVKLYFNKNAYERLSVLKLLVFKYLLWYTTCTDYYSLISVLEHTNKL